jgi:hypothetical protein
MRPTDGPQQDRYFSDNAEILLRQGYSPLPVRGKCPAIKEWQRHCLNPPAEWILKKWVSQFPTYNVGAACGHLVALDIDDETEEGALALQERAFEALGETPLIRVGRAPRRVLLYRATEPFGSIKEKEAQVLGRGTQVVLFGLHPTTKRPYTWLCATPLDIPLKDLPSISEAGARRWLGRQSCQPRIDKRTVAESGKAVAVPLEGQDVREGGRNDFIFAAALGLAASVASFDDLLARLLGINEALCLPPLPAQEIRRAAKSAWGYREGGHLFQQCGQANAVTEAAEFQCLKDEPNAFVLLTLLRLNHGIRQEPFAIVKEAMSRAKLIANWSGKIYAQARDVLLDRRFIELVREGGGRGNPHRYVLSKPSHTGPQYNPTFSVPSSACLTHKRNAVVSVRPGLVGASLITACSAPTLFDAAALPLLPTPDERLRIATREFLSDQPRGTQTRLAGALGLSSQYLTNWKAHRSRLNSTAAAKLRELVGVGCTNPPRRAAPIDRVPWVPVDGDAWPATTTVEGALGFGCERVDDGRQGHTGAGGRRVIVENSTCLEGR